MIPNLSLRFLGLCLALSVVAHAQTEPPVEAPVVQAPRLAIVLLPSTKRDVAATSDVARLLSGALRAAGAERARFTVPADGELLPAAVTALETARAGLALDPNVTRPAEHEAAFGAALLALKGAAAAAEPAQFAEVYRALALTRVAQDDQRLARLYLDTAMSLHPLTDRELFGMASLKPLFAELSAARSAAKTGSVRVESTPPGAEVLIDGEVRGVTPVSLDLPAGTVLVKVLADGATSQGALVDVLPGATASRAFTLPPLPGGARARELSQQLAHSKKPLAPTDRDAALAYLAEKYGSARVVVVRVEAVKKGKAKSYRLVGFARGEAGGAPFDILVPLDASVLTAIRDVVQGWVGR